MSTVMNGSDRYVVISADCHAGPKEPDDFGPYVDPEHREAFAEYVAQYAALRAARFPTGGRGLEDTVTFAERQKLAFVNLGVDELTAEEQAQKYYCSEEFV